MISPPKPGRSIRCTHNDRLLRLSNDGDKITVEAIGMNWERAGEPRRWVEWKDGGYTAGYVYVADGGTLPFRAHQHLRDTKAGVPVTRQVAHCATFQLAVITLAEWGVYAHLYRPKPTPERQR